MPKLSSALRLEPIDDETRQKAIADPGPSWKEWFYTDFLKVWTVLGFLIVDGWVLASWFQPLNLVGLVPSIVLSLYLELLAYRYLWYRPKVNRSKGAFSRDWLHPVPFGRWTPEAARVRAGLEPIPAATAGPDLREFL